MMTVNMTDTVDTLVIGAGVIGLAIARRMALAGREVVVLEAEDTIGTGISSRNSEVIHAGIYYLEGSLRARLCVAGKKALYDYLQSHGVPFRSRGKLVVATAEDGRTVRMPIKVLHKYISNDGIRGRFVITTDENYKFKRIETRSTSGGLNQLG